MSTTEASDAGDASDVELANRWMREANAQLEWKNREDWATRGRLKGLGAMALSNASLKNVPIGAMLVALPKLISTHDVICKLGDLKAQHPAWADDIDYIVGKKQSKAGKAAVSIFFGIGVTAYAAVKAVHKWRMGTKGKHRTEVASRLYEGLIDGSAGARAVVLALFHEGNDAQRYAQLLKSADRDLAIKVLMGKIASK